MAALKVELFDNYMKVDGIYYPYSQVVTAGGTIDSMSPLNVMFVGGGYVNLGSPYNEEFLKLYTRFLDKMDKEIVCKCECSAMPPTSPGEDCSAKFDEFKHHLDHVLKRIERRIIHLEKYQHTHRKEC